jgi:hypothetical protein
VFAVRQKHDLDLQWVADPPAAVASVVPVQGTLAMSMVCPQCKQSHEQLLVCPKCQVRLLYHATALQPSVAPRAEPEAPTQWQQSPWAKLLVGLVLAQGLCYGLHNLTQAGLSAFRGEAPAEVWPTLGGLFLLHALQALSLLVGGALSGAGQRHGPGFGCALGLANSVITLLLQRQELTRNASLEFYIYALPLLHMTLGAVGGLIGMLIWRPTPLLPLLETTATPSPDAPSASLFSSDLLAGPLHLWRISAGISVVVVGFGWSSAILQSVLDLSGGHLSITSHLQAKLVSWEIAALAALLGAALAGANTLNGFKQGLCVGIGASIIVAMIQLAGPTVLLETMVLTVGSIMLLSVAGGWFGGQLFPPILQRRRRYSPYA